jgi:hypothetical protein
VDPQIAAVIWAAVAADKMPTEVFTHYLATGEIPDDVEEQVAMLRLITAQTAADDAALDATTGQPPIARAA